MLYTHYKRRIIATGVEEELAFEIGFSSELMALRLVNRWNRLSMGRYLYWLPTA